MMMAMGRDEGDDVVGDHYPHSDLSLFNCDSSSIAARSPSPMYTSSSFIRHSVSKMDTLAGIAIKYGVEVEDIKRINGLATDLQMFALKSLMIPTPGRHPPSRCLSIGSHSLGPRRTPIRWHSDLYDSLRCLKTISQPQKVSPAMISLQDYYGIESPNGENAPEGLEMAVYNGGAHQMQDDPFPKASSATGQALGCQRKSKSAANGFVCENAQESDDVPVSEAKETDFDKWNEKLIRRRQKSEANLSSKPSELLLKEDNSNGGGFSAITGKGLALRANAASRTNSVGETDAGWLIPVGLHESFSADVSSGVRKSSSASSLHHNGSSPIWPTSKCTQSQALSGATSTRPIFDGLPKPTTTRRNKAALD